MYNEVCIYFINIEYDKKNTYMSQLVDLINLHMHILDFL